MRQLKTCLLIAVAALATAVVAATPRTGALDDAKPALLC
jgi:hypothetical protein